MSDEGINIYVVPQGGGNQIPSDAMQRCLVIETDEHNRAVRVTYHDMFGTANINASSVHMQDLIEIAQAKKISLSGNAAHLLHASPQELENILPFQNVLTHPVKTSSKLVSHYFSVNPEESKLSRKVSGLSHSYIQNIQGQITQLSNKDECRVAWLNAPPTQDVFLNFPDNTAAAYAVAPSTTPGTYHVYYIEKGSNKLAKKVDTTNDMRVFEPFKLNNRGLSKAELEELQETHDHEHHADKGHIVGIGGFGKVKRSDDFSSEEDMLHSQVTKIQRLSPASKIQTIMDGRRQEVYDLKQEASTAEDLSAGSDKVSIVGNKAYMHMDNLGEPLADKISDATQKERVAWSIDCLDEVARINSGEASKRGQRYAHRDIKLPNFVRSPTTGIVRLIDYGLTTTNITSKDEKLAGTLAYAPLDQALINEYAAKNQGEVAEDVKNSTGHTNVSNDDDSVHTFGDSDDDDSIHTYGDSEVVEQDTPKSHTSVHTANANRDLPWQYQLPSSLTQNYLEDDKVAILRTIFCSIKRSPPDEPLSIFDAESFAKLPKPIQRILDTTTIAQLLTEERRSETPEFFEAVLLFYQANPNLSDKAYEQIIVDIRQNQVLQDDLIQQHRETKRSSSPAVSEISDVTMDSPLKSQEKQDLEGKATLKPVIKPKAQKASSQSLSKQASELKKKASNFKERLLSFKRSSAPVSPMTDDEDASMKDSKASTSPPSNKPTK
jgi:serine/threonine protein kinase